MRISVKYKLFFLILSAHVLVYVAMYSVGYYNFQQGFLDYISRIEERQVPALVNGIARYYDQAGSLDPLVNIRGEFANLIRDSIESSTDAQLIAQRQKERFNPGQFSPNDWYYSSEYSPARPYLHLLGADQSILLGEPSVFSPRANLNPIRVNGEIIGYLGVTSRQELSEQADLLFTDQQKTYFRLLAVFLIIVSTMLAFPLAIYLTRPVTAMVAGTRALAKGDYDTRLDISGNDELGELAADFNSLASALDQNRTARQQWIADISHELRTPLSILQAELEAIQDKVRPLNQDTISSLHHEVVHLNSLVNDLHELSLSDLGALVYKKEKINIVELLEQSIEFHQQTTQRYQLTVNHKIEGNEKGEIWLHGDPDRLLQLFDNLLQNSCRYTDAGGEIMVSMRLENNLVFVEWYDSAPGVNDNDLIHLFDRLYRVESSRNRSKGGSGLGLAICQNIIQAHNGFVRADHSPLGGLKLTIKLPLDNLQETTE
jgi:two-component system sensor histidine kinase BaeS